MAKALEQIERDIAELEQIVAELAQEFHRTYSSYVTAFGQAVRQQLILAGYYICTQGHPETFLKLSYSERQQLQQDLRTVAAKAEQQLIAALPFPTANVAPAPPLPTVGLPISLEDAAEAEALTPFNPLSVQSEAEAIPNIPLEAVLVPGLNTESEAIPANPTFAELSNEATEPITKPEQLAKWQEKIEKSIGKTLQTASRRANRVLQQAGVISKKLPEPVLEAAVKAEAAEAVAGPPNLLNLLVETENSQEFSSSVTQLLAIHLRLSEIEFADSTVMAGRNQIRKLAAKATQVGRDYQKKQRERAVAEAEAAWRSSWFEE